MSLIVLDWDDTLLCSTYLSSIGCKINDPSTHSICNETLKLLGDSVEQLFIKAMSLGRVCIVTNAENKWVQLSIHAYLPKLVPYIDKITIISARSTYGVKHPTDPSWIWKYHAMFSVLKDAKMLVSVGDSMDERTAAVKLGEMERREVRTVKFTERPTIGSLCNEVRHLTTLLPELMTSKEMYHVNYACTDPPIDQSKLI